MKGHGDESRLPPPASASASTVPPPPSPPPSNLLSTSPKIPFRSGRLNQTSSSSISSRATLVQNNSNASLSRATNSLLVLRSSGSPYATRRSLSSNKTNKEEKLDLIERRR